MPETNAKLKDIEYLPISGYIERNSRRLYLSPFEERLMWVLYHSSGKNSFNNLQRKLCIGNETQRNMSLISRLVSRFRNDKVRENSRLSRHVINPVEKHHQTSWYALKNHERINLQMPEDFIDQGTQIVHRLTQQAKTRETVLIYPIFNVVYVPQLRKLVPISHNEMEIMLVLGTDPSLELHAAEIREEVKYRFDNTIARQQIYTTADRLHKKVPVVGKDRSYYSLKTDQVIIAIPKQKE